MHECLYVCVSMCVFEHRGEHLNNFWTDARVYMKLIRHIINIKWRVLKITVFKRLNYLSNRNEHVLKMNFKLLLKWIFTQNQCYRFSNDEQLSCSKFFELPHKNGRKNWFPKRIGYFQMHSSFKFYFFQTIVQMKKCLKWKLKNSKF